MLDSLVDKATRLNWLARAVDVPIIETRLRRVVWD